MLPAQLAAGRLFRDRIPERRDGSRQKDQGARETERPRLFVRVNAFATGLSDEDLDAVMAARPDGIVLPKAEGEATVTRLDKRLMANEKKFGIESGHTKIVAIATETAAALFRAGTYKGSSERLAGLTWGAEDLSAALGAATNRDEAGEFFFTYKMVRSLTLIAAKAAGVAAIETLHADFRDSKGLDRVARAAQREGFSGMFAIHPDQVEIINAAFTPSEADVAHAKRVVEAFASGAGVASLDGKMLDQPHLVQARHALALDAAIRK